MTVADWVYVATGKQVSAENTASLLRAHQAIWCMPEHLHPGCSGLPDPGDRLWLLWREEGSPEGPFLLLGGGIILASPDTRFDSPVLWTDTDCRGMRDEAERLGYGGGTSVSFLRLEPAKVLDATEFMRLAGLGALRPGPNHATTERVETLAAALSV